MPAPEGSAARVRARQRLVAHARSYRFIGYTADAWAQLVRDCFDELVDVVGDADVDRIAAAEWSKPP